MPDRPAEMPVFITQSEALAAFCARMEGADFLTVDTEFHRERTYYAKLCLVQVAGPGEAALIDPLAHGIDLTPLWKLLTESAVPKVMHACRQDMEIVFQHTGTLVTPLFDTQVAAQLCGFGESAGYETLVSQLLKKSLDKSQQFTDWQRRPLSDKQLHYALADVTYLREIFVKMAARLEKAGRSDWLPEIMRETQDVATYEVDPRAQWKRMRLRHAKPQMLAILREVAAWRETAAQARDLPRQRVLMDEALQEIAQQAPHDAEALMALRSMRGGLSPEWKQGILAAVEAGLALPKDAWPEPPARGIPMSQNQEDVLDVLKLLLKTQARQAGLVPRLLSSNDDLEALARGERESLTCLTGWRREAFGDTALALLNGELVLRITQSGTAKWEKLPGMAA